MPAWINISANDLRDYLLAEQVDALRSDERGAGQADPFINVSADIIRKVRSYIASNPENLVDSAELTIPPELKTDVCYLILAPLLGRLQIALSTDQGRMLDLAQTTLVALREKKLVVTRPDNAVAPAVQGGSAVELASSTRRQATRESLAGL